MDQQEESKSDKSIVLTGFVSIPAVFFIYLLIFPWTGMITTKIARVFGVTSIDQYIVFDALVSFLMLFIFFLALKSLQRIYANFVILLCAFAMFMVWGVDTKFFWNGFSEQFPLWYEINMAMNDFIAALIVIFSYDHIHKLMKEKLVS